MTPRYSLNHMAVPRLSITELFDVARKLGLSGVEIRNDLVGQAIADGTPPEIVRVEAVRRGLSILSINALQRFNRWTPEVADEARALIAYAVACGAGALVLVPFCDPAFERGDKEGEYLREALAALRPLLESAGVVGLVEPLGFEYSSLRFKAEAVSAIRAIGGTGVFKLVHDTFHHHISGEPVIFPVDTGLIHVSGVNEQNLAVSAMRDRHRGLIDGFDRLQSSEQIGALRATGCNAPVSFEPFAASVHNLADPSAAIQKSIDQIEAHFRPPVPQRTLEGS